MDEVKEPTRDTPLSELDLNVHKLRTNYEKRVSLDKDHKGSKHRLHANPKLFEQDIQRHQDLFETRKVTYLEQETKERFLRAIINDPPFFVEPWDMKDVEAKTQEKKARLKAEKDRTKQLLDTIETKGRLAHDAAKVVQAVEDETVALRSECDALRQQIEQLAQRQNELQLPVHEDPELNVPVDDLEGLGSKYAEESQTLESQTTQLRDNLAATRAAHGALDSEVARLSEQRDTINNKTKEMVQLRQGQLEAAQRDRDNAAKYYRSMAATVLGMSHMSPNFSVTEADDRVRVVFSLKADANVKFSIVMDRSGAVLPETAVSGVDPKLASEAALAASRVDAAYQADTFIRSVRRGML